MPAGSFFIFIFSVLWHLRCSGYIFSIDGYFLQAGSYASAFAAAQAAGAKIFQVIDRVPEIDVFSNKGNAPNLENGEIKLEKVGFAYPTRGDVQVCGSVATSFCEINIASTKHSFRSGVGNLRPAGQIRPAKQNHPARSPFTNFSDDTARLVYFILLVCPSCNYLALYTYEKLSEQKSNFMGWRKAVIDSTTFSCTTT